jgi:hypothetical protein
MPLQYETLHDEDVEELRASLTIQPQTTVKVDDEGKIVWSKDKNGAVIRDAANNPLPEYMQTFTVDYRFGAIVVVLSHTLHLVFLGQRTRKWAQLTVDDIFHKVKRSLSEGEMRMGIGTFLDACKFEAYLMIDDMTLGNKVKTMYEIRKRFEFVPEQKEKKGMF